MPTRQPARADHEPRPRHEDAAAAARAARRARNVALVALVVAAVAVGFAAFRLVAPAAASCQTTAWDATPAAADLPDGWTLTATQYDNDRSSTTLLGPTPADASGQAVVYATVTCFPADATGALSRAAHAASAAGRTVSQRTDLGDQGFGSTDDSGSSYVQFRHGSVVVSIAASGAATSGDVDALASVYDRLLGGDGAAAATPGTSAPASPGPSDASAEPSASDQAAAPELEAALPTKVGDTGLSVDSVLGPDVLGEDQASRAIAAALRDEGRAPDDLKVAQAYDPNGALDLTILAVTVEGMDRAAVRTFVINTWLSASGAGVTQGKVTLAKRPFTKIDYGDQGSIDYVTETGDIVIVIETADPAIAEKAAAALP